MVKNDSLIELAHPEYWNQRYTSEQKTSEDDIQPILGSYEWLRNFEDLRSFFTKCLPAPTLIADLHALGYTNQTSVDFSHVVIDAMKLKYSNLKTRWYVMDVRKLQMLNESVDVAIDKSTLDAMIHGSLWDPPADVRSNVGKYVDEVARVLKPGGQWLYITYQQPHFIKPLLAREDLWTLSVEVLGNTEGAGVFEYFGFMMKRHRSLSIKPITEAQPIDVGKYDNLALVVEREGKYEEAERIQREAIELKEKALGQEHPSAPGSMANLASVQVLEGQADALKGAGAEGESTRPGAPDDAGQHDQPSSSAEQQG